MEFEIGSKFGPWAIEGKLGEGAHGEVYQVSRPGLAGTMAMKLVAIREPCQRAQLEREIKVLRILKSPRLVQFVDSLEREDYAGIIYELAPGRSLREMLDQPRGRDPQEKDPRRGGMRLDRVLTIFRKILEGLDSLHQNGLLHRDLKPSNIVVSDELEVKLVDFGLSRLLDEKTILTSPGRSRTTLTYTAPEILLKLEVGPSSDLYSGGVILFEMVTGRPPFAQKSPAQVATAHISQKAPRISEFRPNLSRWWDRIVEKLLQKNSGDRYSSARFLLNDLATLSSELIQDPENG